MLFPQKINVVASARHANPHNETVVVQNDTAVEFYVAVVGDNGQTELPEGATYTLVCLHLRKQPTEKLGTLQADGNVMFKLTHMELSETGPVQGQVRVYHPVGGRLTSNPFIFHVAPDPTYGAEIKPEDQSIIEQVIGEGPAIIAEAKEETEKNITERDRLTGAVGGALDSLAQDKADALLEMSQSKTDADESAQTALQAADNADQERDRLTQEVSDKITEVETARTDAEEATGEARSAAQLAIDEADAARLQKVEVADILGAGPVASVNGKTGVVDGLATQESVNQVTAQLAETDAEARRKKEPEDLSERSLSLMTGQGSINLLSIPQEKSVTPEKTNFITRGKNKFDGKYLLGYAVLNDVTIATTDTPNSRVGIAPIENGKTYTVTKFQGGNRLRVLLLADYPSSFPQSGLRYFDGGNSSAINTHTFTNDVNAKFVAIGVTSNSSYVPDLQVEEGTESTEFEPIMTLFYGKPALPIDKIKDEVRSNMNYGKLIHPIGAINFNTANGDVEFGEGIELLIFENNQSVPKRVNITPQKYTSITSSHFGFKYIIYYRPSTGEIRGTALTNYFLTNEDIVLGAIQYAGTDGKIDIAGFENYYVGGKLPHTKDENENSINTERFYLMDEITGIYDKPADLESVASGETFDLVNSSHTIIYNIFDDLVTNFPDYVTKTVAGNDGSGLPINVYKFVPETPENLSSFPFKRLKIIITSAIHGHEQMSAWSTAKFFEDLCYNHSQKEQLDFMRYNIEFVVIPVGNPYGYDNNQRVNYNGVDLNRNFPENWVSSSTPGDQYYSGPNAASEIETMVVLGVLDEHSDAVFHIDHHNIASGYPMYYVGRQSEVQLGLNVISSMTRKWRMEYPESPTNEIFGYVKASAGKGTMTTYTRKFTESITLESPWRMPFAAMKYDKITTEVAVDLIGNTITSLCKSFKR